MDLLPQCFVCQRRLDLETANVHVSRCLERQKVREHEDSLQMQVYLEQQIEEAAYFQTPKPPQRRRSATGCSSTSSGTDPSKLAQSRRSKRQRVASVAQRQSLWVGELQRLRFSCLFCDKNLDGREPKRRMAHLRPCGFRHGLDESMVLSMFRHIDANPAPSSFSSSSSSSTSLRQTRLTAGSGSAISSGPLQQQQQQPVRMTKSEAYAGTLRSALSLLGTINRFGSPIPLQLVGMLAGIPTWHPPEGYRPQDQGWEQQQEQQSNRTIAKQESCGRRTGNTPTSRQQDASGDGHGWQQSSTAVKGEVKSAESMLIKTDSLVFRWHDNSWPVGTFKNDDGDHVLMDVDIEVEDDNDDCRGRGAPGDGISATQLVVAAAFSRSGRSHQMPPPEVSPLSKQPSSPLRSGGHVHNHPSHGGDNMRRDCFAREAQALPHVAGRWYTLDLQTGGRRSYKGLPRYMLLDNRQQLQQQQRSRRRRHGRGGGGASRRRGRHEEAEPSPLVSHFVPARIAQVRQAAMLLRYDRPMGSSLIRTAIPIQSRVGADEWASLAQMQQIADTHGLLCYESLRLRALRELLVRRLGLLEVQAAGSSVSADDAFIQNHPAAEDAVEEEAWRPAPKERSWTFDEPKVHNSTGNNSNEVIPEPKDELDGPAFDPRLPPLPGEFSSPLRGSIRLIQDQPHLPQPSPPQVSAAKRESVQSPGPNVLSGAPNPLVGAESICPPASGLLNGHSRRLGAWELSALRLDWSSPLVAAGLGRLDLLEVEE